MGSPFKLLLLVALVLYGTSASSQFAPSEEDVEIDKIFIVGNKVTKDRIILREVDFDEGDVISKEELGVFIDRIEEKIFNTNLFNKVTIDLVEVTPEKVDVLIRVSERWYLFPIPQLRLVDRNFNDWWVNRNRDLSRLEYGIKLYHYNMRGRNERLVLNVQFGFTKQFGVQYRIPYLDKKQRNGIEFGVSYSEQTNVGVQTVDHIQRFLEFETVALQRYNALLGYTYRKNYFDFHRVRAGYRDAQVADSVATINPNYFGDGRTRQQFLQLSYTYTRDYRDVVAYPTKGYKLQITATKNGMGIFDDLNQMNLSAAYVNYFEMGKGFFASNYTSGFLNLADVRPYTNYWGLGYRDDFVRGYELNLIEGQNFLLNKSTISFRALKGEKTFNKIPLEQFRHFPFAVYLKTFFDIGYVDNIPNYEQNSRLTNKPIFGYGIGVDIHSFYDFVGRIEYSFNDSGRNGVYLHFRQSF